MTSWVAFKTLSNASGLAPHVEVSGRFVEGDQAERPGVRHTMPGPRRSAATAPR